MSRTPIRDALGRLEQEGLIRIMPKKGFVISPVTLGVLNMVYETRILIEPYIIENYCQHLASETLAEMSECIRQASLCAEEADQSFFNWDNSFHKCLISQCTNAYMVKLLSEVHDQNNRIRIMSGRGSRGRRNDTISEHQNILNALAKDDVMQAAELMRVHLNHAKDASFQPLGIQNLPYF